MNRIADNPSPLDPRSRFEQCVDQLAAFEQAPRSVLRELRSKITARTFDLVVMGQFKRGKTSVINALLGTELLPVGVVPLTSVVTILAYGDSIAAEVLFDNGRRQAIALKELPEYATERGNPENVKAVAEVHVAYPSRRLHAGMRLIDTPGVGSIYRHNTDAAYRSLPKADAVLLVLSVEQPLSAEEHNFLKTIGGHAGKTFVLLNKADLLGEADLRDAFEFTRRAIADAAGTTVPLFAVSARLALQGANDPEMMARSGFPKFLDALDTFLLRDSGTVLEASIARQMLRAAAQTRAAIELECKALTTPLDDLQRKLQQFELKKDQVKVARDDSALLLGKEAIGNWMARLDRELAMLRDGLQERLAKRIEQTIEGSAALSTRELAALLERMMVDEIRAGFDTWREAQNQRLGQDVSAWFARHARLIDDAVDELFRFSSELFEIAYDSVQVDSAWTVKSGFYYKFWSEPPSMHQLATAIGLALPRRIGHRLLRTRYLAFSRETIDTQSGRTRYDLLQRLEASVRDFRRELMERIETAIGGIEAAIYKGTNWRDSGTAASAQQVALLRAQLQAVTEIESEIRRQHPQGLGSALVERPSL